MDAAEVREIRARVLEEVAAELEGRSTAPQPRSWWKRVFGRPASQYTVMKAEGLRIRAERVRAGLPLATPPEKLAQ